MKTQTHTQIPRSSTFVGDFIKRAGWLICLLVMVGLSSSLCRGAAIVQDVGATYIAWEAENQVTINNSGSAYWGITNDATASHGAAIWEQGANNTGSVGSTAQWSLLFRTPGTYHLYIKYTLSPNSTGANSYKFANRFGNDLTPTDSAWKVSRANENNTTITYTVIHEREQNQAVFVTYVVSQADVDAGIPKVLMFGNREAPGLTIDRIVLSQSATLADAGNAAFDALANSGTPVVASQTPVGNTIVSGVTNIEVNFSVPVTGVTAGALLANGTPATAVTGSGSRYTFTVTPPADGAVGITFAPGTTIVNDSGDALNLADPANSWNYTVNSALPGETAFTFAHVGGGATGSITRNGAGDYTFVGGGNDIWSGNDEFDYAFVNESSDFDVRVRVESLQYIGVPWTKAGLMTRETLTPNSRMAFMRVTPTAGANDIRFSYNTATASGSSGEHEDGSGNPAYPNQWLRLQRSGNTINAYRSTDGLNWTNQASQDTTTWTGGAMVSPAMVGLAVSRHSGSQPTATAQFRDYGSASNQVILSSQPQSQTVPAGSTASFSVTVAGGYDFVTYQWRKNGVPIPGATSRTYTTPVLVPGDAGSKYSVAVRSPVPNTAAVSSEATLGIVDSPVILTADNRGNPGAVYLTFNRPVDATTAQNLANYSIPGLTISSAAFFNGANDAVVLTTSPQAITTTYTLTATGITDTNGVVIAPNPTIKTIAALNTGVTDASIVQKRYGTAGYTIGGTSLNDLTNNVNFPNNPSDVSYRALFEIPTDAADNYGATLAGTFVAPVTGNYTFYISADDNAAGYLSTDANPASIARINFEPQWNGARQYKVTDRRNGAAPENKSAVISLVAGEQRYLEARVKEGGGGDNLSMAVEYTDTVAGTNSAPVANNSSPIPASFFKLLFRTKNGFTFTNYGPVTLVSSPQSQTINEAFPVTFSTAVDGTPGYTATYYSNGVPVSGAVGLSYTFSPLRSANGSQWYSVVANGFSSVTSAVATLTIIDDTTPPTVLRAFGSAFPLTNATIVLSERAAVNSITNPSNYVITNDAGAALAVLSASLRDNTNIVLQTAAQTPGDHYTIVINGVTDRAGVPNPMAANTLVAFTAWNFSAGFARMEVYNAGSGGTIADLTSKAVYPYYPTGIFYITAVDSRQVYFDDSHDNYGARISGIFIPPTNGNYVFRVNNDDDIRVNGSLTENPAEAVQVLAAGCCRSTYTATSSVLPLVAGNHYFYEVLWKEGGGGDYAQMTFGTNDSPVPIQRPYLGVWANPDATALTIVQAPPSDVYSIPNNYAGLTVVASNSARLPQLYQWQRFDGASFTNIPGATASTYVAGPFSLGDDGAQFRVILTTPGRSYTGTTIIHVQPDSVSPTVIAASADGSFKRISITYSEAMNTVGGDVGTELYYTILKDGIPLSLNFTSTIVNVSNVVLTLQGTDILDEDSDYRVEVCCASDANGNFVDAPGNDNGENFHTWVRSRGYARYDFFLNIGGTTMAVLFAAPSYVANTPDVSYLTNNLNWPQSVPLPNGLDNYGLRMSGFFRPPADGNYTFSIRNDDDAQFRLSTDENPANLANVISVACCDGNFRAPTTVSGLVGGRYYYFEAYVKEGGGGDYLGVAVQGPGIPNVTPIGADLLMVAFPTNASINGGFDQQPQSVSAVENSITSFSATVTNNGPYSVLFQWQQNDGSGWTNISGANGASYTTPLLPLSANGRQYRALAYLPGQNLVSSAATLTVTPDTTKPTLISAASANGTQVGVRFSEPIDPVTGGDTNNYAVDGIRPLTAVVRADGSNVVLVMELSVAREFILSVSNLLDRAATGNSLNASNTLGKYWLDTVVDIGGPTPAGTHLSTREGEIEVDAGGNDVWGTSDQFTYAYTSRTNDFDVKVRVDDLKYVGNAWAKGGLNIRESTAANSRMVFFYPTPLLGSHEFEGGVRFDNGTDVQDLFTPRVQTFFPAWIRITRSGSQFSALLSTNGTYWVQIGGTQNAPQFPSTLLVGLHTVSHQDGTPTTGKYAHFGDTYPHVHVDKSGAQAVIRWDGPGVLQYTDDFPATWTSVPAATSPYTVPVNQAHRYYRVQQMWPTN